MVSRVKLFLLVFSIPIIGLIVSEGIQAHYNSQMRSAIIGQNPSIDRTVVSKLNLDTICKNPPQGLEELCRTNTILNLMSLISIIAGISGFLLLTAIRIAGNLAKNSRGLLLSIFKPGLYFTAIGLIMLIIVDAGIAMAALYYGESALINRVHVGIIAGIGLGAVIGIYSMSRNTFAAVRKATTSVIGKNIERDRAPELWNRVEQIADTLKSLKPEHIVVGLDPNFFVTEADVTHLNGTLVGRTLYCSLPLSRILSTDELSAIIGHELGHFKGKDTQFSMEFYPVYSGTISAITSLEQASTSVSATIALMPAIAVFSYFLESFAVAENKIGRERELAADSEGAGVAGQIPFATALVKVHAYAPAWGEFIENLVKGMKEGKSYVNTSQAYANSIITSVGPRVLENLTDNKVVHPTDSHPPLGIRLEALKTSLKDVTQASLDVAPVNPGIKLINDAEEIEREVSESYQSLIAKHLGINAATLIPQN